MCNVRLSSHLNGLAIRIVGLRTLHSLKRCQSRTLHIETRTLPSELRTLHIRSRTLHISPISLALVVQGLETVIHSLNLIKSFKS